MKRTKKRGKYFFKPCITAVTLSAVVLSGIPVQGLSGIVKTASAAGTPAEREDNTIVYFVDCGDYNVTTVSEGDQFGTHNSVTDQIYGKDPVTGYAWGIDDTISTPAVNGSSNTGGVDTDWTWPYESNTADGVPKTSSNRYTKNQFEKGIETRYLDYKFEIENGTYYIEAGFADPWGCSKEPAIYLNKDQKDEKLVSEAFDVAAGGPAVTTFTVTDGVLSLNLRGSGTNNLAINLTYIIIKKADAASMLKTDYNALDIKAEVSSDIILPVTGKGGSSITWTSSNPDIINADGKVAVPEAGAGDANVTLTATIVNGTEKMEKKFEVTVMAKSDFTGLSDFNMGEVQVTDSYYVNSLDKENKYLLSLDTDRLLAGFRETAGCIAGMAPDDVIQYMNNAERYGGGWENALIGGHTLGHWLSAMAQAYANKGTNESDRADIKKTLDSVIDALADCQAKTNGTEYEGYLFGATLPSSTDFDIQFDNVEKGLANISTQAWVPWYTMHKILAGLITTYELEGNETAYNIAKNLGNWIYNRVIKWDASTQKTVLGIEYGGMNDCLYDLYDTVTAKEGKEAAARYAEAAHKFDEETLFNKVYNGTANALDNTHANTTIPKFLGALNRYETLGDGKYLEYTESFWDYVVNNHSYITGGNSEWEHFGADNILDAERTNCNCETCNTYNMLKLSRKLFMVTGKPKYTNFYENTLINAIMPSQNPETGMSMYFQPMASGYHKVFGTEEGNFWCCTGSGMENFTKLNDSIYYQKDNNIIIAQYLASEAEFKAGNLKITQEGDLSKSDTFTITVKALGQGEVNGGLRLRLPDWLAGEAAITVDNEAYKPVVKEDYAVIPQNMVKDGTKITITLPMETRAYNLPDNENTYAFKYGPYVLSAKLGTDKQAQGTTGVNVSISTTKAINNDKVQITSADSVKQYMENISQNMVKADGKMEFTLSGTNNKYIFVPHYSQYKESYAIYWTFTVDEEARDSGAVLEEKDRARKEAAVTEAARPGYGQDELGFMESGAGSTGSTSPCYRFANAGGSFKYDFKVSDSGDSYLICTFAKEEDGKTIKISSGSTVLFEGVLDSKADSAEVVNLAASDTDSYYQVKILIPADVITANKTDTRLAGTETEKAESGYTFIPVTFESAKSGEASAKICLMNYIMKAYSHDNSLEGITSSTGKVSKDGDVYTINFSYKDTPKAKFEIADSRGYVSIDGNAIDETAEKTLKVTGQVTIYNVKVYAEDFESFKEYTVKAVTDFAGIESQLKPYLAGGYSFEGKTDGATAVTKAFKPVETANPEYIYTEGINGKAIKLSGDYGLLLGNANKLGESYTISWWMKPDSIGSAVDPTFAAGTFSPEYWLNATFDAKIWSNHGGYIETKAANAYQAETWQHVAITVDGETEGSSPGTVAGTLYVNGEAVSKGDVAKGIMTNNGAKLYFGVNAWDAYFKGAVDEIMLFNKAISEDEVHALNAGIGVSFISGGNNTANNNSGNNSNGDSNNGSSTVKKNNIKIKVQGTADGAKNRTVKTGSKLKLVADTSVIWKSSDNKIASVSGKGIVKVKKKAGTARITAISQKDKKQKAEFVLNVVKKAKKNKVLELHKTKYTLDKKGAKVQIKVKKLTKDTTDMLEYKVISGTANVKADIYGVITVKAKPGVKAKKAKVRVTCGKVSEVVVITIKQK